MEKKWIDDVYVIKDIDSTSQLIAFYKEVVDNNIEKYVGISTQGVKFKLDSLGEKAVQLRKDEEYGINPNYRKIEITPIEEVVAEVEASTVQSEVIPEQTITMEQHNQVVIEKDMEITQLNEKCSELSKDLSLHKERADYAEQMLELANSKVKELTEEVEQLKQLQETCEQVVEAESETETYTVDELLNKLCELGWKAYITKIN